MATVTTIKKSKLVAQDIEWDAEGTNSTFPVLKSDGEFRTGSRVNSTHVPSSSTTRAKTRIGSGTPASSATDVDGHLQEVYDDLAKIGEPDGTILEVSSGTLQIAATSITSAKMAANSVDSDQYVDGSIDNAHINSSTKAIVGSGSGASGNNVIQAATIGVAEMGDNSIDSDQYVDGSIDNEHIANGTIKAAKFADAPTHYTFLAAEYSSSDASATLDFTTSGLQASDIIIGSVVSFGTGPNYVKTIAYQSATTIRVTVDTAQSSGSTTMHFIVMRAVTA